MTRHAGLWLAALACALTPLAAACATVTVAGELITHASDEGGDINWRDVQVSAGANTFTAAVPLAQVDDIGGVLYVGSRSYDCSIAPQR